MEKGYNGHDVNQANPIKKDMSAPMSNDNLKNNFIDKNQKEEEEINDLERNESISGVYSVLNDVNSLIND